MNTCSSYRFDFFSRSGERDLCPCDELVTLRSFDLSRSRDNLRCLCFLFDGLRDRPIVLECNTKSKQVKDELANSSNIKEIMLRKMKRTRKTNE